MDSTRTLHLGYWKDTVFESIKTCESVAEAETALQEHWEVAQDEIDEEGMAPPFQYYGVCAESSEKPGEFITLIKSLPLSKPSDIVLLETGSPSPFTVSLPVLCVSLFGGKTKNWKLVRRDVYSGEEGISYIVAYVSHVPRHAGKSKKEYSSGFLSLKNKDGKLIVDAQYLEADIALNAEFEYDCSEVKALFEDVSKPFNAHKKLKSIRKTYSELGENEAGLVSLICPEGPPNNTNIYTLTLKTLQPMFVDGVSRDSITIEVMGDWEMSDLLYAIEKLNNRIDIQVLGAS